MKQECHDNLNLIDLFGKYEKETKAPNGSNDGMTSLKGWKQTRKSTETVWCWIALNVIPCWANGSVTSDILYANGKLQNDRKR